MGGTMVCIAVALIGVDASWQPLPEGGVQHVIQIEPQVLERLESGAIESVASHVPVDLDVRAYQIAIGTHEVGENARTPDVQSPILVGVDTVWNPLSAGGFECRVWIQPDVLDELRKPGRVIEGRIPASVKTLSRFTIGVGSKPLAMMSPPVDRADPTESVAARLDLLSVDAPSGLPVIPPRQPMWTRSWPPPMPIRNVSPPSFPSPETPSTPNPAPSEAWSPPPFESLPPAGEASPAEPPLLDPAVGSAQELQQAAHLEQSGATPNDQPPTKPVVNKPPAGDPNKSSLSPTATFFGLLASLAGNIFLLWILWIMRDFRSRYRALLRRMGEVGDIVRNCVTELERTT